MNGTHQATSALDVFDRIVCINLDERLDRWERVQKTSAGLAGLKKIERFSAIKPSLAREAVYNGRAGCLLSHRRVIESAYRDGLESVLVFEDDLIFDPNFETLVKPTIATLSKTPWDIFYLGMTPKAPLVPAGAGLVRTFGGTTTHAIAYHRRAMPTLLKRLPVEEHVLPFLSRHKSVDRFYWQSLAPRMRFYASSPLLAFQRDDFSDIQQTRTRSNKDEAHALYDKHLVKGTTPLINLKLRLGSVGRMVKYRTATTRRMLFRQIKPKD